MKMLFIAGPYFGDGKFETIEANIQRAKQAAIEIANAGVPFFCPHMHTAHFQIDARAPEPFYRRLALHILGTACKAVYLLPGWENSKGTQDEIALAKALHLPVFNEITQAVIYCQRD